MSMTTQQLRDMGYEVVEGQGVARKIIAPVIPSENRQKSKPQIRLPKAPQPNKTEARFMEYAKRLWEDSDVRFQPMRFWLPSGCYYRPDVMIIPHKNAMHQRIIFAEVKGPHIHNPRSIHAFKEAASAYQCFLWVFAQWRDNQWVTTDPS